MEQTKKDFQDIQTKGGIDLEDKPKNSKHTLRRQSSMMGQASEEDLQPKMEEYIISKAPNLSSEVNNYIRYSF